MNKIAFLFSGQGSQETGMYEDIYKGSKRVKETYDVASNLLGYDLFEFCQKANMDELSNLKFSTPAIFVGGVALFRYLTADLGLNPSIMCGHSLGEYTALTCGEFLSLESGLKLVMKRAELADSIRKKTDSGMLVVSKINYETVEKLCSELRNNKIMVYISCYNTYEQTCIVGPNKSLQELEHILHTKGAMTKFLVNNAPYHSVFMKEICSEFIEYLKEINFSKPKYSVCSNFYGIPYTVENIRDLCIQQLINPVMWFELIDKILRQNVDLFLEISNKTILTNFMKHHPLNPLTYSYTDIKNNTAQFSIL